MKVIRQGSGENWTMQVLCETTHDEYGFTRDADKEHCKSILEINKDDVKAHPWFKYPDYSGIDYTVICPVCGCEVCLDESKIPSYVIKLAKDRLNKPVNAD